MDKIYQQAKDKNVAAVVIYAKTEMETVPVAYADAAFTIKMTTSELKDAFLKGAVIQKGDEYIRPISFAISASIGAVTYAKVGTTDGSAATAKLIAIKD